MAETSLSLLQRARSPGDEWAWRELAELYEPLLRRWMTRYDVGGVDADDLVQETLLFVARRLKGFEHNGRTGAFRCWLRTALVHRLQRHWREQRRRPVAGGEVLAALAELEDAASGLSRLWDRQHDAHVARRLLEKVRPRFEQRTWEAFRLTALEGMKPADAAEKLGVSANAVCAARCRVLSALRQEGRGLLG